MNVSFQTYRNEEPHFHRNEDNTQESARHGDEVPEIHLPYLVHGTEVDEADHSVDDDGCEDAVREVMEKTR